MSSIWLCLRAHTHKKKPSALTSLSEMYIPIVYLHFSTTNIQKSCAAKQKIRKGEVVHFISKFSWSPRAWLTFTLHCNCPFLMALQTVAKKMQAKTCFWYSPLATLQILSSSHLLCWVFNHVVSRAMKLTKLNYDSLCTSCHFSVNKEATLEEKLIFNVAALNSTFFKCMQLVCSISVALVWSRIECSFQEYLKLVIEF